MSPGRPRVDLSSPSGVMSPTSSKFDDVRAWPGVANYDPTATDSDPRRRSGPASLRQGFGDGPMPAFDLAVAHYAPALHLATAQGPRNVEQLNGGPG